LSLQDRVSFFKFAFGEMANINADPLVFPPPDPLDPLTHLPKANLGQEEKYIAEYISQTPSTLRNFLCQEFENPFSLL
jgi:hypothetical protein